MYELNSLVKVAKNPEALSTNVQVTDSIFSDFSTCGSILSNNFQASVSMRALSVIPP
jgi:hypothetical protein